MRPVYIRVVDEKVGMEPGYYSNIMFYSYWLQCKNYLRWGYDPCRKAKRDCVQHCVAICERSHEFGIPSFVLHVLGCNLRCRFCWSECLYRSKRIKKKPREVVDELICKLSVLNSDKWISDHARIKPNRIKCIRITGHEPTLQWVHLTEVLKILDQRKKFSNFQINIQTNGIEVGKTNSQIDVGRLEQFENLKMRIEVSFKGVNPKQFGWLADRPPHLFYHQCDGFEKLWDVRGKNVDVVAELGINHCNQLKGKKYLDLGVYIIDQNGKTLDFSDYDDYFKKKVLSKTSLEVSDENKFQEFGGIDKKRATDVIATYSKTSGKVRKRCLPSSF